LTYVSAVFDPPDTTVERVDERTVRVAGSMTIDDVNEALGTDLDTRYARTRAGLVLDELGRRPRQGDEVQLGDVRLQVEQLDGHPHHEAGSNRRPNHAKRVMTNRPAVAEAAKRDRND